MEIAVVESGANLTAAWDVLLLGGPSGVGKSRASYPLARQLGIGITEIDDLHIALARLTTPEQQPELHYFQTHPEAREFQPEHILERFIDLCRAIAPAVITVVANHVESRTPIVLEGDYLLPETVAELAATLDATRTRAVFLYESDEDQIVANYLAREPGAGTQRKRARVSWLHGEWLKTECTRLGLRAVPSRPWDSLLARISASIE